MFLPLSLMLKQFILTPKYFLLCTHLVCCNLDGNYSSENNIITHLTTSNTINDTLHYFSYLSAYLLFFNCKRISIFKIFGCKHLFS